MSKLYESIDEQLTAFIDRQKMFFVGTAPRSDRGHVNVSPKGLPGTFAVIDPYTVACLDLTGSGVETIAHLRENGRICLMFCAFEGAPRIVRIRGTGEVIEPGDSGYLRVTMSLKREKFSTHHSRPGATRTVAMTLSMNARSVRITPGMPERFVPVTMIICVRSQAKTLKLP